jgi:hypothetical protein
VRLNLSGQPSLAVAALQQTVVAVIRLVELLIPAVRDTAAVPEPSLVLLTSLGWHTVAFDTDELYLPHYRLIIGRGVCRYGRPQDRSRCPEGKGACPLLVRQSEFRIALPALHSSETNGILEIEKDTATGIGD